jgi:hypothetical protein
MTVGGPVATLVFPERSAPLAVLAASKLADVPLDVKPDAKLNKDAAPTLVFPGGCVHGMLGYMHDICASLAIRHSPDSH